MTDRKPKAPKADSGRPPGVPAAPVTAAVRKRYVAKDYATHPKAPVGKWVCAPTSELGPFKDEPTDNTEAPHYCGQCVSYVRVLCPTLPQTTRWVPGDLAKTSTDIEEGTIIATFDSANRYMGHAAVYVSRDEKGLNVYDQWVTGKGKAIGPRPLRYGAPGSSNNGDLFYIVTS